MFSHPLLLCADKRMHMPATPMIAALRSRGNCRRRLKLSWRAWMV